MPASVLDRVQEIAGGYHFSQNPKELSSLVIFVRSLSGPDIDIAFHVKLGMFVVANS